MDCPGTFDGWLTDHTIAHHSPPMGYRECPLHGVKDRGKVSLSPGVQDNPSQGIARSGVQDRGSPRTMSLPRCRYVLGSRTEGVPGQSQ